MVTCDDRLFCDVRLHVMERLVQHTDNLQLWESGYLSPTEPDPEERRLTVERLKAAIYELNLLAKMWGQG
jgi:hypothetical protein